jgi:predicted HNH restriction endonuclease
MNITDISITSDDIITETNTNGNITEENFKFSKQNQNLHKISNFFFFTKFQNFKIFQKQIWL